jgi:hypothetical protein
MSKVVLDFSFDMKGLDRYALLAETAERLNVLRSDFGETNDKGIDSHLASLVQELQADAAAFAKSPVVEKITEQNFTNGKFQIGDRFRQLTANHDLYCLTFPVYLHAKSGGGFNKLEAIVEFNPEHPDPATRPKAIRILPEKQFQTQLQGGTRLEFGLDENLEFKAGSGTIQATAGTAQGSITAGAGAKASTGFNFLVGPFVYRVKKAKIEHSAVGLEKVFWRLDGAEFFQEDDFPLVVLMQVPKKTAEVRIAAVMQAYRHFSFLSADLQDAVSELGKRIRNFFEAGTPLRDQQIWDISSRL